MTTTHTTREAWLHAMTDALRPVFHAASAPLPDHVHLSVGFPSSGALSSRKRTIGQCWDGRCSSDGHAHVFVSPVLVTPFALADTLTHELVHVVTPGARHKGAFVKVANKIGLTNGKPTSASAGPELTLTLNNLIERVGIPLHVALTPSLTEKKQGTRLLKCECLGCGYIVRTTAKWIEVATPNCPVCDVEMEVMA